MAWSEETRRRPEPEDERLALEWLRVWGYTVDPPGKRHATLAALLARVREAGKQEGLRELIPEEKVRDALDDCVGVAIEGYEQKVRRVLEEIEEDFQLAGGHEIIRRAFALACGTARRRLGLGEERGR